MTFDFFSNFHDLQCLPPGCLVSKFPNIPVFLPVFTEARLTWTFGLIGCGDSEDDTWKRPGSPFWGLAENAKKVVEEGLLPCYFILL